MTRMDSLDKEAKRDDGKVPKLGYVKLQSIEPFTNKGIVFHHENHHRPISSSEPDVKVGHGDGPTCNKRSITNDTYDVVGGSAAAGAVVASCGADVRAVQPFDTSNTATSYHYMASKSPAGRMAGSLGFPFTNAQWKELERQAMIYKYMIASVPVPPELLIPIIRTPSDPTVSHSPLGSSSGFNLRLSSGTDPEPGRCKRTDGKKWRCSRDVALDHKYCERHLHRGRPRSRKPVEVHTNNENINNNDNIIKRTRREDYQALPTSSSPITVAFPNQTINSTGFPSQFLGPTTAQQYHQPTVASFASHKEPWSLDWMVKGAHVPMAATTDQQWHPLMQTKMGFNSENSFSNTNASMFKQSHVDEPLNQNLYAYFRNYEDPRNKDLSLSSNPDMVSTQKPHTGTTRGFFDAWSNTVSEENMANCSNMCSVSSNRRLSPSSSLTLSMGGGGNSIGEEIGQIQMGLGLIGRDQNNDNGTKSHLSNWLTPTSSIAPTPGGPLAEVLRPSTTSNHSSPILGDSSNSPVIMVSSPSGVLQRTIPSLSDSSANSSNSNLSSSGVNPEMALLWLN